MVTDTNAVAVPIKASVGAPRKNFTKVKGFVENADGTLSPRGQGKPSKSNPPKIVYLTVAWDWKVGMPFDSTKVASAPVKKAKKVAAPAPLIDVASVTPEVPVTPTVETPAVSAEATTPEAVATSVA